MVIFETWVTNRLNAFESTTNTTITMPAVATNRTLGIALVDATGNQFVSASDPRGNIYIKRTNETYTTLVTAQITNALLNGDLITIKMSGAYGAWRAATVWSMTNMTSVPVAAGLTSGFSTAPTISLTPSAVPACVVGIIYSAASFTLTATNGTAISRVDGGAGTLMVLYKDVSTVALTTLAGTLNANKNWRMIAMSAQ